VVANSTQTWEIAEKSDFTLEIGEKILYHIVAIGYTGDKGVRLMVRRTSRRGGFSLIEVLLVVFILGALCLTLISIFVYGLNLLSKTTQTNLATQVAQFEIERFRNMAFDEIDPAVYTGTRYFQALFSDDETSPYYFLFKKDGSTYIPLLRNGREIIVVQDGQALGGLDANFLKMTVTVEWDYRTRTFAGGDPMRKDFVTYFSKEGINRR